MELSKVKPLVQELISPQESFSCVSEQPPRLQLKYMRLEYISSSHDRSYLKGTNSPRRTCMRVYAEPRILGLNRRVRNQSHDGRSGSEESHWNLDGLFLMRQEMRTCGRATSDCVIDMFS